MEGTSPDANRNDSLFPIQKADYFHHESQDKLPLRYLLLSDAAMLYDSDKNSIALP